MKTYQLKEPTVQAAVITGVQYALDDGTTVADAPTAAPVGNYWVRGSGTEGVRAKPEFEAEYAEVPGPLA